MIPATNSSARSSEAYSNFRDGNENVGGESKSSGAATELTAGSNSASRAADASGVTVLEVGTPEVGAIHRYPRRSMVSIKTGLSAGSPSASRSRLMALLM